MKTLLTCLHLPVLATITSVALTIAVPTVALAKPPEPVTATVDVKTGMTAVVFDEAFTTAFADLGAEPKKIIPGQFVKGKQTYRFPVRGGACDLTSGQAEIIHSGGVKFSSETVTVSLTDFILTIPAELDPGAPTTDPITGDPIEAPVPTLSALVVINGELLGRIALFNLGANGNGLDVPAELPRNKKLALANVELTLTAEGADALNAAFEVTSFAAETSVGTASVGATMAKRPL